MTISPRSVAQKLMLIIVLLTPIFSLFEVIALFQGSIETQSEALTPVAIKALRDVTWIALIVFASLTILKRKRLSTYYLLFGAMLFFTLYCAITAAVISPVLAMCGIRWITPVFLVFFLIDLVDKPFFGRLFKVMSWLLIVQLMVQFAEFFFASGWFGKNSLGFSSRSPGMFIIPNTGAIFSILCLFLAQFYSSDRSQRILVSVLSIVSVFLTASGTGYVVLLVILFLYALGEKWLRVSVPVLGGLLAISFPALMSITGRGDDYVDLSFGRRVEIFFDAVRASTFLPEYFGIGTNTGVLLGTQFPTTLAAQTVDSTYASIVINMGLFGFAMFAMALAFWIAWVVAQNRLELYAFTVIFVAFGAVTIIPECFPANLIFAALLSHYLKTRIRFSSANTHSGVLESGQSIPKSSW